MAFSFPPPPAGVLSSSTKSPVSRLHQRKWTGQRRQRMRAHSGSSCTSALSTPSHTFEGVSWSQVEAMCKQIAAKAQPDRFDVILAVTRGGLVPATLLCETFELRNILSATVIFYTDDGEQFFGMTEPRFLSFPSTDALEGRRVLIVDDVWDSGRTAHAVKKRVERANPKLLKVAVLHFKPDMNIYPSEKPDFFASTTSNWVVYPWERASPKAPQIGPGTPAVSQRSTESESTINSSS